MAIPSEAHPRGAVQRGDAQRCCRECCCDVNVGQDESASMQESPSEPASQVIFLDPVKAEKIQLLHRSCSQLEVVGLIPASESESLYT